MLYLPLFLFWAGALWGSFLNVVGYRVVRNGSLIDPVRSSCPSCHQFIQWFDLIPIISFFILQRRCRQCGAAISWLYPFIECLTGGLAVLLFYYITPVEYQITYFIFLSALVVIIRSDLETMLIAQCTTLWLIPVGLVAVYMQYLPITFVDACCGAVSAYLFLWAISFLYTRYRKVIGMGEGDMDLLAMIGAFTGVTGWWLSLMIGSLAGSCIALCLLMTGKLSMQTRIPFGPLLAFGALTVVFFKDYLMSAIFFC